MKDKKNENTEKKILGTANEIFEKKGYAGTKMQEIADSAGINKALLHYYFRSKDKLFEKIFMLAFGKLAKQLEFLLDAEMPIVEKIETFVDKHMNFLSRNRHLPLFIINEINRRPEIIVKVFSQLYEEDDRLNKIMAQIDAEQKAGKIRIVDTRQVLLNLLSMNIFPFAAKPLIKGLFDMNEKEFKEFIKERKTIVTELIINSIVIK